MHKYITRSIVSATLLAAALFCASPVEAQDKTKYYITSAAIPNISYNYDNRKYRKLLKRQQELATHEEFLAYLSKTIIDARTHTEFEPPMAFLWRNTYDESDHTILDINYFLLMSDALLHRSTLTLKPEDQTTFRRQALKTLLVFEMMALVDAVRCTDPSGWRAFKKALITPRLRALKKVYPSYSEKQFTALITSIQNFEKNRLKRQHNALLCQMGTKTLPEGTPLTVSTYVWHTKRDNIYATLKRTWMKRYNTSLSRAQDIATKAQEEAAAHKEYMLQVQEAEEEAEKRR